SRVWTQPAPSILRSHARIEPPGDPGGSRSKRSGARKDDLAVLDLDQIDARIALAAFLTRGAGFVELDRAIHPGQLDLPERRADRLGVGLARLADRRRDRAN